MDEPLACSSIVFRAMARKNWIDELNNRVLPAAHFRRPAPKDEDGLSVDIYSADSCAAALNKCYGVASLHVGHVRDLGLDVIIDARPHANIAHVPRPEQNREQAERLASLLAKQSRLLAYRS